VYGILWNVSGIVYGNATGNVFI